jgi:hypothetical protein
MMMKPQYYPPDQANNNNDTNNFFDKVLRITAENPQTHKKAARKSKAKPRVNNNNIEEVHPRPQLSYNELIIEAIENSPDGMLSLQEIYDYIQNSYLFFKDSTIVIFI